MAGRWNCGNQRLARSGALPSGNAMVLVPVLAGLLLVFAAGLLVGPRVQEAEADALLRSLRQASARCSIPPAGRERQARVIAPAPTIK